MAASPRTSFRFERDGARGLARRGRVPLVIELSRAPNSFIIFVAHSHMLPKAYRWVAEMEQISDFTAADTAAAALFAPLPGSMNAWPQTFEWWHRTRCVGRVCPQRAVAAERPAGTRALVRLH